MLRPDDGGAMRLWLANVKLEARFLVLADNDEKAAALVARAEGFDHLIDTPLLSDVSLVVDPSKLIGEGWDSDFVVTHHLKGEGNIKLLRAVQLAIDSAEEDARKAFNDAEMLRLQIPLFPSEP